MKSKKCNKCGLVSFATETTCKNCGNSYSNSLPTPINEKSKGKSIIYNGGLSGSVNTIIIIITSCVVCSFTIYWAKQFIPDGTYLIGCFIPFAFLGYVSGVILANLANLINKMLRS